MKCLVMAAACLLASAPASAQVVRLSVATDGTPANGSSFAGSMDASGRYVVFQSLATNLAAGDADTVSDIYLRDRDTDADGTLDEAGAVATTLLSITPAGVKANGRSTEPVISADGRYVAFVSAATNLLPGANGRDQIYRVDRTTGAFLRISQSTDGVTGDADSINPAISADGNVVAFRTMARNLVSGSLWPDVLVRDVPQGTTARATEGAPSSGGLAAYTWGPSISADGRRVAFALSTPNTLQPCLAQVVDRITGARASFSEFGPTDAILDAAGRHVVTRRGNRIFRNAIDAHAVTGPFSTDGGWQPKMQASPSGRYAVNGTTLYDFDLDVVSGLSFWGGAAAFSADDRWLLISSYDETLPNGADTDGLSDVMAIDLPAYLDRDGDTMNDRWEYIFDVTDPNGDPDHDGVTNAAEEDAGTHPTGTVKRFLAEGATGSFFSTRIGIANPDLGRSAVALLSFTTSTGVKARRVVRLAPGEPAIVDVGAVVGLEAADVSTTIESDRVLAISREVEWGMGPEENAHGYGSHAEAATAAPSTTWFLAEGSTVVGFELFYLLQNPQAVPAHATVRYLLPMGTVVARTYDLPPNSRTTIYVNTVPGLDETDVSADVETDLPIIVERAMYRSLPGQPFSLGTGAVAVPAAATRWFLAEGATGGFFDLYVLIANPSATDAQVTADYALPDGTVVSRQYVVRANSRYSVYVDAIPGLSGTSVSTTVTATNGVPIVVERAMYWPGGFFDYYEGHAAAGSTTTARRWGSVFDTRNADGFVLIANTENRTGRAEILTTTDAGQFSTQLVDLAPNSRTTVSVAPGAVSGVFITSSTTPSGGPPVELVVETSSYRTVGGVFWSAGSNAMATPVP